MVLHALRRPAAVAACLLLAVTDAAAAPLYRLTRIPPVGGVTECYVASLNDSGQVAGTCFNGGGAFLWSAATGSVKITVPGRPQDVLFVKALNNLGQIAGTRYWEDKRGSRERGFVWDPGAGFSYFGDVDRFWTVSGLNDDTAATGWRAPKSGDEPSKAYTWTPEEGVAKLRPYAHRDSRAFDINNHRQAVGTVFDRETGKTRQVVFEPDGSITTIALRHHRFSAPTAISEPGHVTGYMPAATHAQHAFLWTPEAGALDIDPRPSMTDNSQGKDLNDADQVVGTMSWQVGDEAKASVFSWDPANGMLDLMTLIDPDDPLRGQIDSLAFIDVPMKINNLGQIALTVRWVGGEILPLLMTPVP